MLTDNLRVRSNPSRPSNSRLRGSDVFAAIGDATRRRVLDFLSEQELAAGQIAGRFQMSRPAVSQHLRILREAQLVSVRRRGREQVYRLNSRPLRDVARWIDHYRHFWNEKLSALDRYLDEH